MSRKEYLNNCVEVTTTKKGGKIIKIKKDFTVKQGEAIFLKSFEEHLQGLVDNGIISPEQAENDLEKRGFIEFVGTLPPSQS